MKKNLPTLVFVCVHNSCRSQMAEAFAKKYGKEFVIAYSAGTALKDQINPDAVRLMKERHNIDMERDQKPKLIDEIPKVDYVVTMGCQVVCPQFPYEYENIGWQLEDPTGKGDHVFIRVMDDIEEKVKALIEQIAKKGPCR